MIRHCHLRHRRLGDLVQIMGDQPPADPAFHPILAVVAAASEAVASFEATDPPFDPRPPIAPAPAPALPLKRAIRRVMNVGLDHRAIDTQLAPAGHLALAGLLDHVVEQLVQHLWLDQIRPASQGGVIRHLLSDIITIVMFYGLDARIVAGPQAGAGGAAQRANGKPAG